MIKIRKLGLTFLLVLLVGCGSDKQYAALPASASVIILGDSLSYGTGAGKGEDFPSLLAASTGWNIINAGRPGDTSAGGLSRLPDLLASHQADLLIIELGGNDFLRRLPAEETMRNLEAIIQQAKRSNIQPLLVAIPQFTPFSAVTGSLSDHALYQKIADDTDTPLIEDVFSTVLVNQAWKTDPIHPNAEGYRQVAQYLHNALTEKGFVQQAP